MGVRNPIDAPVLFQRAVLQQLLKQPPGVTIADTDGCRRLLNPGAVDLPLRDVRQIASQTLNCSVCLRINQNRVCVLQLFRQIVGDLPDEGKAALQQLLYIVDGQKECGDVRTGH